MIVISGALVIIALGLLIAGLVVSSGLVLVYASIGVSVLSAIFLFLGVRQRRDEGEPGVATTPGLAATGAAPGGLASTAVAQPAVAEPAVAPVTEDVRPVSRPVTPPPPPVEPVTPEPAVAAAAPVPATAPDAPTGGEVYVVPGRPRYHAAGCRYLSGRDTETRDAEAARAEGFTACGVCRPDDTTAATTAAPAAPTTGRRSQSRTAQSDSPAAASARARKAPATEPSSTAPGRAVAAETAAAPASSRARAESVIVIPERGRFHRAECRYVRGVESAREMTKSGAKRQGYSPCGVCKP